MREDPVDHRWLGDERDDAHRVAAPRTAERVELEDPAQQACAGGTTSAATTEGCAWTPAWRRMPRAPAGNGGPLRTYTMRGFVRSSKLEGRGWEQRREKCLPYVCRCGSVSLGGTPVVVADQGY